MPFQNEKKLTVLFRALTEHNKKHRHFLTVLWNNCPGNSGNLWGRISNELYSEISQNLQTFDCFKTI